MLKYLTPFLEAFFFTIFSISAILPLAKKIHWSGRKAVRHIHKDGVYRIGGIAMVLAFNLAILVNGNLVLTPELLGFMVASVILMLVGVWDDVRELFWKTQLFFQMAAAFFVFIVGVRIYYITNPLTGGVFNLDLEGTVLISLALVVFWIVFVINAINWIDGVDGLSGGISLISIGTIFFLSFKPEVNQPPVAIISSILFGVILGFLVFNFNPARILAGTSGAMFMGLALAILAIFSGTKIATAILVLVIPIIDFIWVIGERIKNKQPIFRPDNNHLHHKLLEIGWSQKKIATYYYAVTIIIALIALHTKTIGKSVTLIVSISIMLFASFLITKKLAKRGKS
ncbi:MAG: MraY family glycosyltransferase [Candidatus Moranbacteria bacterium]|nr:MraY family glycosyltransferase [Candidatus Moranbacteria bacterium]